MHPDLHYSERTRLTALLREVVDNLRPLVPIWSAARDQSIVLWLRGTYRSYTDYDLDVVALLPDR